MHLKSGHSPRKRFGQNFLHDQRVIDRIIRHFGPENGQNIVEIGPGLGALTWPLLEHVDSIHLIELDRDLVQRFIDDKRSESHLQIHQADALSFDFSCLGDRQSKLRIIGNLPYNISTPLMFHLLDYSSIIQDMLFMLQKEVVQRIAASPGGKEYGRLSVMIQARCAVRKVLDVKPGAFTPPPKVDSAVIELVPFTDNTIEYSQTGEFARIVKASFAQRRKTLRNNLKGLLGEQQIRNAGIDPAARAETLTVGEFSRLAGQLISPD
jgi:16S rRNA (adenine1518-N6/adenine1519-N6)-dimethyltransferase